MMTLFADITTFGMANLAIWIVILAVLIGVVVIVLRESGIKLPPWVWQIGSLILLAVVAILAIKFLVTL